MASTAVADARARRPVEQRQRPEELLGPQRREDGLDAGVRRAGDLDPAAQHDVQRVARVALVEDHLPAPVAPRPDGRGDAVEVLVAEVVEQRHPTERGPERGRVRRLSRLAHAQILRPAREPRRRRPSAARQEIDRTGVCADSRPDAHARGDLSGERLEGLRRRARLALGDRGHAGVAALADGDVERDLAQEVEAVLLGEPLPAAAAEDLGAPRRSAGTRTRSCSRPRR